MLPESNSAPEIDMEGAAAHRLTARPLAAFWLSGGLAVAMMWTGLWLSYASPTLPPSFAIVGVATVVYLAVLIVTAGRRLEQT